MNHPTNRYERRKVNEEKKTKRPRRGARDGQQKEGQDGEQGRSEEYRGLDVQHQSLDRDWPPSSGGNP